MGRRGGAYVNEPHFTLSSKELLGPFFLREFIFAGIQIHMKFIRLHQIYWIVLVVVERVSPMIKISHGELEFGE